MGSPDSLSNLTPASCIVNCLAKGPTKRFAGQKHRFAKILNVIEIMKNITRVLILNNVGNIMDHKI